MPRGAISKPQEHQYTSYDEAFPTHEGPPGFARRSQVSPDQPIVLTLQARDFISVWELVEEMAQRRWDTRNSSASTASYVRSVELLRAAWRQHDEAGTSRPGSGDAG